MDIKRRVKSLEEKYKPTDRAQVRYRKLFDPIMRDPEARDIMRQIADKMVDARPEFHKRLKEIVTDEELLAEGIDPELWRRGEAIIREKIELIGDEQA